MVKLSRYSANQVSPSVPAWKGLSAALRRRTRRQGPYDSRDVAATAAPSGGGVAVRRVRGVSKLN